MRNGQLFCSQGRVRTTQLVKPHYILEYIFEKILKIFRRHWRHFCHHIYDRLQPQSLCVATAAAKYVDLQW